MKTLLIAALLVSACHAGTSFRWYPSYKGAGQNQYTTNWLDLFQAFQADVATNLAAIMDDGTIPVAKIAGGTNAFTPKTTTVSAGDGLTGGGDLSANRTLAVGAGYGVSVASDAVAVDTSKVATLVHLGAATNTLASRAEVDGRTNALGLGMLALSNALAEGTVRTSGGTMYGNLYLTNGVIVAGADGGVGGNGASITLRSGHAGAGGAQGGDLVIDTGFGGSGYGSLYLRHLAAPATNTDAANKQYVDSAARPMRGPVTVTNDPGFLGLAYAVLADGSLTLSNAQNDNASVMIRPRVSAGGLEIVNTATGGYVAVALGHPSASYHAATRGYVDGATNVPSGTDRVLKAGDTMTGTLEMDAAAAVSGTNDFGGYGGPLTVRGGDVDTGEAGDLVLRGGDETSMGGYGGDVLIRGGNCTAGLQGNVTIVGGLYGPGQATGTVTILSLPEPTEGDQAAPKFYVDALATPGTPQFDALTNALKAAGVF